AGIGRDIVFGGAAGDTIVANAGETASTPDGNDVVFGDYGFLDYVAAYNPSPISLDYVWSSDEGFGGADTITTGTRNDFVFGGIGADVIDAGKGNNVVFGDHGRVTGVESAVANRPIGGAPVGDDYPVAVLQLVEGYVPTGGELGGDDKLTTGVGHDMVFGGAGADVILANAGETASTPDGNDVVFGDYGFLDYVAAYNPSAVSLDRVWSSFEGFGGADTITTGAGNDFVFGGIGGDTIVARNGQNIVFGDHGRVTGIESTSFNRPVLDTPARDDYPIDVLQLVEGYLPTGGELGGSDQISTGVGRDMVFGGGGSDTIVANAGETTSAPDHNNIVFGDYGFVDYLINDIAVAGGGDPLDNAHDIDRVWSLDSALGLGGNDTITTGIGSYDVIIGGAGNDTISSGGGGDLVFGDNARLSSTATDNPNTKYSVHEFSIGVIETVGLDSGNDTIYGSPFNDILFGGGGDDVIYGYAGNDLIFGDQGKVTTAPGT
ncbi:MAG: calcium-binding protein, partial [Actinobacteria bacterium]|nr:calcium-binding protein [Actinomycetota bacterium]